MRNTITSKNSWELLLSSIAGAFDGADIFVLGTLDERENYKYKTVITNHRTNEEISKCITAIKLTIPDSKDKVSSIKATFNLEDLIVQNDDYVTIKILNSTENAELTVLKGKVKILKRDISQININLHSVEIVDEFNKLFEKVVAEDIFLFDKYIYSERYKENSILYIIAKKLGFTDEQMNFEDIRDSQSRLVKIPFTLLRKGNRYIDELQTLLDVTKGRVYIDNLGQLVFENGLFEYEKAIVYPFDVRNILKNVGVNYKYTDKNGVRVIYDSYKYLTNQVIFDLANKVEVAPGTTSATAKELVIKFITDLAVQHNITKAEGYYYENEQQIRIYLQEGIHYELMEFSETSAKVKFLNPYATKFYIDKFEIKGIPLAMFSDNEVSVKATKDMLENEENFSSYNKNKYIQTEELASDIARVEYIRNCKNKKEYSFKASFVPHLEPGDICTLKINDIDTRIQISNIEHTLSRVNGFYSEIVALEYEKIEQEFNYSKLESLTAKDSFLGTLNNIKDQVDETDKKLEEVILIEGARGFVSETNPSLEREIKENDVWFNPGTKVFKVWRNGQWNSAREEDITPSLIIALKAQAGYFTIGGNDVMAGIFFNYDNDSNNPIFGATDSENLAQVSIDKKANVLIRNVNNKLAFNMRNPENPSEVISQLLMGVYNADDLERHKNTLFQVGDESTGTYLRFLRDGKFTQQIDNKEIKQYFKEFENQIDGKINTFSQSTDPSINWTEDEQLKSVGDLWYNPTTKATKRWNGTAWEEQDVKDKVAQALASSKRRVFTTQPTTPYDAGDLWITNTSSTGDMMICVVSRLSGRYVASEWKKATKYTDDTAANIAQQHARQAEDQATLLNQKVESYASEGVLTPSEKAELKREIDTIEQEINPIVNRAEVFGVSIGNIWETWSDLAWWRENVLIIAGNYTGDVNSLRNVFKNYYNERQAIFDRIERMAKELADNAQNTGNIAINNQNDGNLTISANTIFDGKATFISHGSDETTVIRDGSISFTRGGETITTIRNMRAGTVVTDGYGSGYVDFIGMKSNLFILPSIKAFDVSANVRSLNCRVEKDPNFLAQNRYKFFVYGTEEVYEGTIKEVINSQNYTQNAYSVGVEAVEISLYSNRISEDYFPTSNGGGTYWSDMSITGTASPCQIGIKVYINGSYYGESVYEINHSYCSLRESRHGLYLGINVPRLKISLGNFSLTTKDKNDKTVRIETYLKSNPTITCSGKIWKKRGGRDEGHTPKPYSGNVSCNISSSDITFYLGHYFYSPSYIQNIVGGGEVQYLAIEQ